MQHKSELCLCVFGTLVAVLLRCCTSLHPYSGQGKSPMFGDYEAQRHWMEITVNLPVNQWYKNSTSNDLMYWGLDYPPLTAYHSYVCGLIGHYINPHYVELQSSRGYESEEHKTFMRFTVLLADLVVFIPAIIFYFVVVKNNENIQISPYFSIILALLYPGLILIDHGHFQYNCVSLGFTVLAITFISIQQNILGSLFYCLALNYKQMELYHALPFFMYLLSICIPKPGLTVCTGFVKLCKISLTVVVCFAIIWAPFLFDLNNAIAVLVRLFPVARGVFEDKVSNVWCVLNIVYKFKNHFDNQQMLRYCLLTTLASIIPSSLDLFLRPNLTKFVLALINSSLGFFLFSYQVHEKSILLVAVPVMLYFQVKPFACFWFLNISVLSMFPLFVKDGLVTAFFALLLFYFAAFYIMWEFIRRDECSFNETCRKLYTELKEVNNFEAFYTSLYKNFELLFKIVCYILVCVSCVGSLSLVLGMLVFEPPQTYPDIFPLLISVYACIHFLGFFVYFNVLQFKIPQVAEDVRYVKVKDN